MVAAHFHYMDKNERYTLGSYPTREDAIDACRRVIGGEPFITGEPRRRHGSNVHYLLYST
jgi:hypothetical protein